MLQKTHLGSGPPMGHWGEASFFSRNLFLEYALRNHIFENGPLEFSIRSQKRGFWDQNTQSFKSVPSKTVFLGLVVRI